MSISLALPFSRGEAEMHHLLHVPQRDNPTSSFLTSFAVTQLHSSPLLAVGTVDDQGRPWTTVWGGESGFAQPLSASMIGVQAMVERKFDPVVQALMKGAQDGDLVKSEGKGKMVGGLAIHLENRKRVKLYGRMIAGSLQKAESSEDKSDAAAQLQLAVKIEQSMGNCPKYLNKKHITPAQPDPKLISHGPILSQEAISLINSADLFFMSSSNADLDMDTNHRGGPNGFVRVLANDESGAEIVYPEYSGNRLYQSLGNLRITPFAGLVFPDLTSGNVLYLTGHTEILIGQEANRVLPRTNLAVKIKITDSRFVEKGLTFRGVAGEPSPYNPGVRLLTSEGALAAQIGSLANTATLVSKLKITPTVTRYRWSMKSPTLYKPGQWVALDFSEELDMGYSHMREDDPTSLNDDFVRTFTVSSYPSPPGQRPDDEFEITVRRNGPVTSFLESRMAKPGLEVTMRGFGGYFHIETDAEGSVAFLAGGVGVTPLLGQARGLNLSRLQLIWACTLDDIPLVLATFEDFRDLIPQAHLFFRLHKSTNELTETEKEMLGQMKNLGIHFELRGLTREDLAEIHVKRWYLCSSNRFRTVALDWLKGQKVLYESFDY